MEGNSLRMFTVVTLSDPLAAIDPSRPGRTVWISDSGTFPPGLTLPPKHFFTARPPLHRDGARTTCRVLSVGPRRCLVECFGHDINLT